MVTTHYRSIWISDLHLGSRGAMSKALNAFLRTHSCDYLYLVGDVIDFWALRRRSYFPQNHVDVIRKVLKRASNGAQVFYIVGNHDEVVRQLLPLDFGNIKVRDEVIHETASGSRLLVVHGDRFDQVTQHARWLAIVGDVGYTFLLRCNRHVNWARRCLGLGYWSLSAFVKHKVKGAVSYIGAYETAVAAAAREHNVEGVVCGHIHHAELRKIGGLIYGNCGDWVESRTALAEDDKGDLMLLHFAAEPDSVGEPWAAGGQAFALPAGPATTL